MAKIAQVNNRLSAEYIDKKLNDNSKYIYKVVAVSFDGIPTQSSKIVSATTKPLPERVTSIVTTKKKPRKIELRWSTKATDIAYFNIYRSKSIGSGFKKIKSTNKRDYTDKIDQDGLALFYKISIVDKDGLEGEIQSVTGIQGSTLSKPLPPIITYAQFDPNSKKISLKWENQDNRVKSFILLKKEKSNKFSILNKVIAKEFKDLKVKSFVDNAVIPNMTYKYAILGVDEFGLISLPSPETIIITPEIVEIPNGTNPPTPNANVKQ